MVTESDSAVRPVLQSLSAMTHPEGLESFRPSNPRHFAIHVSAFIGTGDGYVDSFDLVACTPSWLADHFPDGDEEVRLRASFDVHWSESTLFGSGLVFLAEWSYDDLRAAIEAVCARHSGPDWGSIASRIGRLVPWEFDYKYDRFINEHPGAPFPPHAAE